jgi:Tfp pilus assembly protein PilF
MLSASIPVRLALFALLATAAYAGALRAGVAWDDSATISANPAIRTLAAPWRFFLDPWTINPSGGAMLAQYRPLRTLAYALQFAVFGGEAWGFHLVSLLLHAACALAVGALTTRLFGAGGTLAAALWLIHPALAENAVNLAAQGNLLCLLAALLACLMHLRWLETRRAAARAGAIAAAVLAMLAYEHGVLLPLLLLAIESIWLSGGGRSAVGWLRRHAPYAALLVAYLALRFTVIDYHVQSAWWGGSWASTVGIQLRVFLQGWSLTLFPQVPLVRYTVADVAPWAPTGLALAANAAIVAAAVVAVWRRRWRAAGLAALWWYVAQGPTSNLVVPNLGYPFATRFLFLALLLPVMAAAAWYARGPGRRRLGVVAAALLLVVCVPLARVQVATWQSARSVAAAMLDAHASDFTANFNYGIALARTGETRSALPYLERAAALDPGYPPVFAALGLARAELGDEVGARRALLQTLKLHPAHVGARIELAELDLQAGNGAAAQSWIAPITELRGWPPYAFARANSALASLHARLDSCSRARQLAEAALGRWQHTGDVVVNAARAYHACGEVERARELFRAAAEIAREELLAMVGGFSSLDA